LKFSFKIQAGKGVISNYNEYIKIIIIIITPRIGEYFPAKAEK